MPSHWCRQQYCWWRPGFWLKFLLHCKVTESNWQYMHCRDAYYVSLIECQRYVINILITEENIVSFQKNVSYLDMSILRICAQGVTKDDPEKNSSIFHFLEHFLLIWTRGVPFMKYRITFQPLSNMLSTVCHVGRFLPVMTFEISNQACFFFNCDQFFCFSNSHLF